MINLGQYTSLLPTVSNCCCVHFMPCRIGKLHVVMCTTRPGLTQLRLGDIMSRALGLRSGSARAWLRLRPWLGKAGAQAAQATAAVA